MRKTLVCIIALAAIVAAYSAWPFFGLYEVVRAAQSADAARLAERVDFPALQRSLSGQIMGAYMRMPGARPERSGLILGAAFSLADPLVAKLLTPENIAEVMKTGWSRAVLGERTAAASDIAGLDADKLGTLWQLYFDSDYGIGEFRVPVPVGAPAEKQFRIRLALSGWRWRMSGLDIPHALQDRLALELMRQNDTLEKALRPG